MTRLSPADAAGMTVNERLFVTGQLQAFDSAVSRHDERKLRRILATLYLTDSDISAIVLKVLGKPTT